MSHIRSLLLRALLLLSGLGLSAKKASEGRRMTMLAAD